MAIFNSLKNCVAFVTGAKSGLGRATALRILGSGGRVLAYDKQKNEVSENYDQFTTNQSNYQDFIVAMRGSVENEQQVSEAVAACMDKFGRIDLVVNCAGVAQAFMFYHAAKDKPFTLEVVKELTEINTLGTFNVNRLTAAEIVKNGEAGGCIINTSCYSSEDGIEGQVGYATSKGGLNSMALTMARELASLNIRCTTIIPGFFATPLVNNLPQDTQEMLADITPFPSRIGNPDEFAHLVQTIYENPYLNGCTIRIDGALRMYLP